LKLKDDTIQKITEQENTGAEKSKLFPSDLGLVVTDFLSQHFTKVMDYSLRLISKKNLMRSLVVKWFGIKW
ncbi:MAG TPA: hypothetical protein VK559_10150, partial [Ferruginibacter sp.]|nr:hypothetical protein [Ferruginibacter sp.]